MKAIEREWLKPYASFMVLESLITDHASAEDRLISFVRERVERRTNVTFVGNEIRQTRSGPFANLGVSGLAWLRDTKPGWASADSPFVDSVHELFALIRHNALVAIHAQDSVRRMILTWLDDGSSAPYRRISSEVLEYSFLRGASKGLWLKGTHPRRATKADTKNLAGSDLREALNPLEDSTFVLSSGRASTRDVALFSVARGTVGTTPRKTQVWNRSTETFDEFLSIASEILNVLEETLRDFDGLEDPFPTLANEDPDPMRARMAYEIVVTSREELAEPSEIAEDVLNAISVLENAALHLTGDANSPNFTLDVGVDGRVAGTLGCTVTPHPRGVALSLGFRGSPTDGQSARKVLDALSYSDLFTVHYASGHVIHDGRAFFHTIRDVLFPNWDWVDFDGFHVDVEKVSNEYAIIHRDTGSTSDVSLFGWVVSRFNDGHLTCDDGPGEVADFVHIADDGTLSLIFVKAANGASPDRQISAAAYEQVVSQATKSVQFLDPERLKSRLSANQSRATWHQDRRLGSRREFVRRLEERPRVAQMRVVIVQPHVRQARVNWLHSDAGATFAEDRLRFSRLQTMLVGCHGTVVGVGADLRVVSAI